MFDADLANQLARLESFNRHLYRPNTYLHKWWARRCGSTFRLILKSLVEDPSRRDYYAPGGLEGKIILDPMMGGGTTLHEAIRLGANVIGADIDPVPVLQARATLSNVPLAALERAFAGLIVALREALAGYYATSCPHCSIAVEMQFLLYGLRRFCDCGSRLFVDSVVLRQEADGLPVRVCRWCLEIARQEDVCGCVRGHLGLTPGPSPARRPASQIATADSAGEGRTAPPAGVRPPSPADRPAAKLVPGRLPTRSVGVGMRPQETAATSPPLLAEKGAACCNSCGGRYREDLEVPFYARYEPFAVVARCPSHGRFFKRPGAVETAALARANDARAGLGFDSHDFAIDPGPKSADLPRHGVRSYLDLFSSRQLLYLHRAVELLTAIDPRVRLSFALLLSTSLEFNSMLCGYKGGHARRPGAIRHTFSHHAYSFPYTALENNPLYPERVSGTLENLFDDRIRRARRWAQQPVERRITERGLERVIVEGEADAGTEVSCFDELRNGGRRFLLIQGSSASLPVPADSVDYVITDPPYFNSVQYSDLAAFFRVWLRKLVPHGVAWEYDPAASAVDGNAAGDGEYARLLGDIFREGCRVLRKERGRLIFTFHHWHPRAWAALTLALQQGPFKLQDCAVVHSENPASVHIANLRALTHDAILVLAPAPSGTTRKWPRPKRIDTGDSAEFCCGCAEALGWMLGAGFDADAIGREWRTVIG